MMRSVHVVIWLVEGTWPGCLDAAANLVGGLPGAEITLLYVSPTDVGEAVEAAAAGLLGRAVHGYHAHAGHAAEEAVQEEASALLEAAGARLGRQGVELVHRRGRPEREVVEACARADILVVARDGDRSRLGPHSLGHATRFVVDHAPCDVLVVWPDGSPGTEPAPPPPSRPAPPHGPHGRLHPPPGRPLD